MVHSWFSFPRRRFGLGALRQGSRMALGRETARHSGPGQPGRVRSVGYRHGHRYGDFACANAIHGGLAGRNKSFGSCHVCCCRPGLRFRRDDRIARSGPTRHESRPNDHTPLRSACFLIQPLASGARPRRVGIGCPGRTPHSASRQGLNSYPKKSRHQNNAATKPVTSAARQAITVCRPAWTATLPK